MPHHPDTDAAVRRTTEPLQQPVEAAKDPQQRQQRPKQQEGPAHDASSSTAAAAGMTATAAKLEFRPPHVVTLDPIRMVYIEGTGKFSDIAPRLWETFHGELAQSLTTTHRFVGAAFPDGALSDGDGYGGVYRAGAFQERGAAPNHDLDKYVDADDIEGSYLQLIVNGNVVSDWNAAWKQAIGIAKTFSGVRGVDLNGGRPCLEIFLNVAEPGLSQREGGMVTELLVPVF